MRVISVAGMPQSGSTMFFNIVRVIIEEVIKNKVLVSYFGLTGMVSGFSKELNKVGLIGKLEVENHAKKLSMEDSIISGTIIDFKKHEDDIFLVKVHDFDKTLLESSDVVFLSKRDIKDCILSRRRRGKKLNSKGQIQGGIFWPTDEDEMFNRYCEYLVDDCYSKWLSPKTIVLDYDMFCKNHKDNIIKIGSALGESLTSDQVDNVINKISTFYDYECYKTGFTPSKITDKKLEASFSKRELSLIERKYGDFIKNSKRENPIIPKYITTCYKPMIVDSKNQNSDFVKFIEERMPAIVGIYIYITLFYCQNSSKIEKVKINNLLVKTSVPVVWDQEISQAVEDCITKGITLSASGTTILQRYTDENGDQPAFSMQYELKAPPVGCGLNWFDDQDLYCHRIV